MIVTIIVEHNIQHGKEHETLKLIRNLRERHSEVSVTGSQDDLYPDNTKQDDCYGSQLQTFDELNSLSITPGKVRVYMAA